MSNFILMQKKVILIADNLNTHTPSSFYEAFPPQVADTLSQKVEFHYALKYGSWLNIAECELSILSLQCLGKRRIDSIEWLNRELSAWETDRNIRQKGVNWQLATQDARLKLKPLYLSHIFS